MSNRLNLDWALKTSKERADFINRYIQQEQFKKRPLSKEEISQCSEYILWGKDEDGKNGVQKKDYQIATKKGTWDKKDEESLDALLETPTFNEALILAPGQAQTKISRDTFSRKKALEQAPEDIKKIYISLFREIDEIDLILNYYDLSTGKRKNPPRKELLSKFTEEEQQQLKEKSTHLNPYKYLKLRHELVDLRRSQFSLRDNYVPTIQVDDMNKSPVVFEKLVFDVDMNVYPFGVLYKNLDIFKDFSELIPTNFSEEKLNTIIQKYWRLQNNPTEYYFDFENSNHIYELLLLLAEIETDPESEDIEDTLRNLLDTLQYYIDNSDLTDCQKEILEMKVNHKKNQEIIDCINKKYNKNYTANYISTIFRQKIIKKITECATYHKELVLNLPFEEEFKKCSTCGTLLLRHSRNFVKKSRAKDGFTNRCKECDKKERQIKKGDN